MRFGLGVLNVIKEICFANEIIIFARYILMNEEDIMLAYTYIEHGKFELQEKARPEIKDSRDAIVRVTLGSICTSDLHIKHGSVPRAVPGITVGHEMVGVVEQVGADVTSVKLGDRVTVNVETFCGECFFCKHGYVNNCTDPNGGWALGCLSGIQFRNKHALYFISIRGNCLCREWPQGDRTQNTYFDTLFTSQFHCFLANACH